MLFNFYLNWILITKSALTYTQNNFFTYSIKVNYYKKNEYSFTIHKMFDRS